MSDVYVCYFTQQFLYEMLMTSSILALLLAGETSIGNDNMACTFPLNIIDTTFV